MAESQVVNPAAREIARAQSRKNVAEALKQMRPAETPGADVQPPAPQPAPIRAADVPTEAPPTPEPVPPPVTPDAPPQEPPKPAGDPPPPDPTQVNAPPNAAPDRSWQAVHSAEKRLAEDREKLDADRRAFDEERKSAQPAAAAGPDPRQDPIGSLTSHGWTKDQIAQLLIKEAEGGTWQPQQAPTPAPVAPQPAPAAAAQPPPQPDHRDSKIAELEKQVSDLYGYAVRQKWDEAARSDPKFAFIAQFPQGIDFALERGAKLAEHSSDPLTIAEVLDIAQSELIEQETKRVEALRANPATATPLGLTGSPASPVPPETPAATPPGNEEPPLTSLSNQVAPSAGQTPIPAGELTEAQRLKRAVDAMRKARQQG